MIMCATPKSQPAPAYSLSLILLPNISFRECFNCNILQQRQSSAELSRSRSPSNLISGLDLSSVHHHIDTYLMMPCAICGD